MEQRFGYDFSLVRVHSGAAAEQSAQDVNAYAYTVGHNIVFGAGRFAPGTDHGRRLLAHELTHVTQSVDRSGAALWVQRQKCGHDQPQSPGCGRISTESPAGEDIGFPMDRLIVQALQKDFGGTWIAQVYSPANPVKGGKAYGFIDAVKVTEAENLTLEIAEIKSRNTAVQMSGGVEGGCGHATDETKGYIAALKPLKARMAAISKGLETIGGLKIDDCRKLNNTTRQKLTDAGVNTNDETDMWAWCMLNSVQRRLQRAFTKGFASVVVEAFEKGTKDRDYYAFGIPISCPDKKQGSQFQIYQVNKEGGISYRCERFCTEKKRRELEERKDVEARRTKEVEIQTEDVKEKFKVTEAPGDEDIGEGVEVGPGGIDNTDLALASAAAVTAMAGFNIAYAKAKSKAEQEFIRRAAIRVPQELARRGATDVARAIDGKNLEQFGTKAYKGVEEAEHMVRKRILDAGEKKLEKKLLEKGLKKTAKKVAKELVEFARNAGPLLAAFVAAVEVLGAIDAYAKGAEFHIGLSGGEAELEGDTKVDIKGEKAEKHATIDANMTDTQIHVEMVKAPETTGTIDIETNKVTMKGKVGADGTPVTVSLSLKIENTTITYTSTGRFKKGGKVELAGALDITDSVIEIALPPDAEREPPKGEITRELKGVKLKITKVATAPGQKKVEGPAKVAEKGDPITTGKGQELSADEAKLVDQIREHEKLATLYAALFKAKGLKPDKATLERLLALKAKLDAHPEYVDLIIKNQFKAKITDLIKDVIEPIEELIKDAEQKRMAPPADIKPSPEAQPGTQAEKKPEEQKVSTPSVTPSGPTEAEKKTATALAYWGLHDHGALDAGKSKVPPQADTPTAIGWVPITYTRRTPKGDRTYEFTIRGTLIKAKPKKEVEEGYVWQGDYSFFPPAGLVRSTQGDEPIYFTDAATPRTIVSGKFAAKKRGGK